MVHREHFAVDISRGDRHGRGLSPPLGPSLGAGPLRSCATCVAAAVEAARDGERRVRHLALAWMPAMAARALHAVPAIRHATTPEAGRAAVSWTLALVGDRQADGTPTPISHQPLRERQTLLRGLGERTR